jgi:hypothetical protein
MGAIISALEALVAEGMFPKSGHRSSETIMPKQKAKAKWRFDHFALAPRGNADDRR